MENNYIIDMDKLKAEQEAKREERDKNLKKYLKDLEESNTALARSLIDAWEKREASEDEKRKAQMQAEIEDIRRKAEEEIKKKYKEIRQSDWNESDVDRALRELARSIGERMK